MLNVEINEMTKGDTSRGEAKRMKASLIILITIITVGLLGSCVINIKEENMSTQNFDLKGFSKVEVGGAFEVEVVQSDSFDVTVTADDFAHIRVEKSGDTLYVKHQGIEWFVPFHHQPKARIALPVLTGLNVSGASQGKVQGFQSDTDLSVTLSGASHVTAQNITTGKVDIKVSGASTLSGGIQAKDDANLEATGASKITLTGNGANTVMVVNGASRVELSDFPVQSANLKLSGASHAFINTNGRLDANVSGASSLLWSGSPVMGDIQTSGASTLRRN
jgi:hypothetical protein